MVEFMATSEQPPDYFCSHWSFTSLLPIIRSNSHSSSHSHKGSQRHSYKSSQHHSISHSNCRVLFASRAVTATAAVTVTTTGSSYSRHTSSHRKQSQGQSQLQSQQSPSQQQSQQQSKLQSSNLGRRWGEPCRDFLLCLKQHAEDRNLIKAHLDYSPRYWVHFSFCHLPSAFALIFVRVTGVCTCKCRSCLVLCWVCYE